MTSFDSFLGPKLIIKQIISIICDETRSNMIKQTGSFMTTNQDQLWHTNNPKPL